MRMRLFINIKFKWNYHCLYAISSVFNRFTIAICLFSRIEHAYLTQIWHVTCVEHYNYNVEMTAHSTQPPQKLYTRLGAYFVLHNDNESSRDQRQDQERKVRLCVVCVCVCRAQLNDDGKKISFSNVSVCVLLCILCTSSFYVQIQFITTANNCNFLCIICVIQKPITR